MHVHLSYTKVSALPALLANGVTSVRDCGGRLSEIDMWREQILAATLAGPRIFRAGPMAMVFQVFASEGRIFPKE
jgi:hypothetical protein